MQTVHAIWERENLGVETYEITLSADDTARALEEEEARLIALGAAYIVLKSPVNCPALLFGLPKLGYTYVETVFHVEMKRGSYRMPDAIARFDRGFRAVRRVSQEEVERVCARIRGGVFMSDRVTVDPAFSQKESGNRYANWLKSILASGGFLYEVMLGEKPIGFFVVCRKDLNTVDPVLMGMYDEQNDRGLGTLLHKKTMDTCFEHDCKRLTSTIVSNNQKVLRAYVNAGASILDALYTYVKHV